MAKDSPLEQPRAQEGSAQERADISDALIAALAKAGGKAEEDVPELLRVIAEGLDFDIATLWWWRPEEGVLRCEHVWWRGKAAETFTEAALGSTLEPGDPVPGTVFVERRAVWIPDVEAFPHFRRSPAAVAAGLRSGFAFPILARGEVIGVIELFTPEERVLDAPLFNAVTAASSGLGDFIERLNLEQNRARLLAELGTAHRRQQFLLDATRALSTARGLDETIERLATVAVPAIGDLCLIDAVAGDGSLVRLAALHRDPMRQSLVDQLMRFAPDPSGDHPAAIAIRTGQSFVSAHMSDSFMRATTRSEYHLDLTQRLGFTSYVSVPLLSEGRAIGALTVVSSGSGRHFGAEELSLVEELAVQVASVIERERRYDEQHEVAQFLQRSMLPEPLEAPEGLEVCGRCLSSGNATEAGGDFYDVVALQASTAALVIGDVEGHDLVAIAAMAKIRSAALAFLQTCPRPQEVVELLDRFVEMNVRPRIATVSVGVLDIQSGLLQIASAGHPAPLIVAETVEPLECRPGPPLGAGGRGFEVTRALIPEGAGIVLYTDGLIETRELGPTARFDRLVEALGRIEVDDLGTACDKVIAETLAGEVPIDDVTLLFARRTGA
jgi:serine phosphatase RsbU (regulator of sigma subunit)